jgi:hypothetical protein
MAGWSYSKVSKAITELEEGGWLEVRKRYGKSTLYILKRPVLPPSVGLEDEGLSASPTDSASPTTVGSDSPTTVSRSSPTTVSRTTSYYDQDEVTKTKLPRREGANAPRKKTKSRSLSQDANTVNQPVAEESSPGGKRKGRKSVKAADIPLAIAFIRDLVELYPPKELWPRIVEFLGENYDAKRVVDCYMTWIARGHKPTNYDGWLFDWYLNGIPEQGGKNGKFTARKSGGENLRDAAEWICS